MLRIDITNHHVLANQDFSKMIKEFVKFVTTNVLSVKDQLQIVNHALMVIELFHQNVVVKKAMPM